MKSALLALSLCAAAGELPGSAPAGRPSSDVVERLEGAEASLRETESGRRLLAETGEIVRLEEDVPETTVDGIFCRRGDPPVLLLSRRRLRAMSDGEVELSLARELARAAMSVPVPLPEEDMAAYQAELEFAMEQAARSGTFARRLREAYRAEARRDDERREQHRRLSSGLPPQRRTPLPERPLPRGQFERAGLLLHLFARDPDEFYYAVERGVSRDPDAVTFAELEDFVERYGPDFAGVREEASGLYVRVGGRSYPPRLLRHARVLARAGGLAALREALGPFQSVGVDELKVKVNAWLRADPQAP